MATQKRYYWLKLQDGFFTSKRIKKLRKLAGGDTYTIIYLKMQLLAMKTDGVLRWSGLEDDFASELALDLDEEPDNVAVTLQYLLSCGLAETDDNTSFFFPYAVENTGSETSSAERMRNKRAQMKLESAQCSKLCEHSDGEKNIEKDTDKELRDNTPPLSPPHGGPTHENEARADGVFRLPFDGELGETVKHWLIYKQERREKYKPAGLKSLCTQIQNSVNEYGEQTVMTVIRESMASGYKGIMFDRLKQKANYKKDEGWSWDDFR